MIQFVYKLKDNCTIVKRYLIRNFSSIYWEIKKLSKTASKNGISTRNSIYIILSYKFSDWWRKIWIFRKTGLKIKIQPHYDGRSGQISLGPNFRVHNISHSWDLVKHTDRLTDRHTYTHTHTHTHRSSFYINKCFGSC